MQSLRSIGRRDGSFFLRDNASGIQAGIHFHDRDASRRFILENSPLYGGSAAVLRQQRSMYVQTSESRQIQNCRGKNLAVSGHGDQFRFKRAQLSEETFLSSPWWLQ